MTRTIYKWMLFVRTAIRGIASSPVTSGVSVVTIGVTLVLVGAFALLLQNMEGLLDQFGDELRVTAYLESDVSDEALRALQDRVLAIPGVEDVEALSQEEALERFRASVGSGSSLLDGLDVIDHVEDGMLRRYLHQVAIREDPLHLPLEPTDGHDELAAVFAGGEVVVHEHGQVEIGRSGGGGPGEGEEDKHRNRSQT